MNKKERRRQRAAAAVPGRGGVLVHLRRLWPWFGGILVLVIVVAALVVASGSNGTSSSAGTTPSPTAVGGRPDIDGIPCQSEMLTYHVHTQLMLFQQGHKEDLPALIGIPRGAGCLYWLHTHSTDGIIHIEAPVQRPFTLGEFFDIWGQPLSAAQAGPIGVAGQALRIYVDGTPYTGDPRQIALGSHTVIVIEAGVAVPPPPYTFPTQY